MERKIKSEGKNIVENLRSNKIYKYAEHKNIFEVEKVGHKNSVDWNHSNSIHIDQNHNGLIQPITHDSTNIGSIHDSAGIRAIGNILASPEHSMVPA